MSIIAISSILLIVSIILQQKGSGLSGVFGGSDVSYMSKRGVEKFLVVFTIVAVVILSASTLLSLLVQ
jgi:protein translocase SecG subunit